MMYEAVEIPIAEEKRDCENVLVAENVNIYDIYDEAASSAFGITNPNTNTNVNPNTNTKCKCSDKYKFALIGGFTCLGIIVLVIGITISTYYDVRSTELDSLTLEPSYVPTFFR